MKKKKKWKIVLIILAIGIIAGALGIGKTPKEDIGIEWEEDGIGSVTFDVELPNGYVGRYVVYNYYKNVTSLLDRLDKNTLKEGYEYLEFTGRLVAEDGTVMGIIRGELPIEFILEYEDEDFDQLDVEDNLKDVFIPKFLREE